jgi:hypothetical protein
MFNGMKIDPKVTDQLILKPGASIALLREIERTLGVSFPAQYVEFMTGSNGAEGFVGPNSYLMLWPVEEIASLNQTYEVHRFAPGLTLFGSDGGGTAYAFDTRSRTMPIFEMPFVGMNLKDVRMCGHTFVEFLEHLYDQD